ncbi:unnamed protein product [Effrenium voratum]|nr:unnamed protein product [Effrenium voratum]
MQNEKRRLVELTQELQRLDWAEAVQAFSAARDGRVQADAFTYGVLVNSCAKSTQWLQSLGWLQDMQQRSLQSDTIVFNAAITSCGKGSQWQHSLALLEHMQQDHYEADLISFNAVLSACEKGRQWQKALQVLQELGLRGLRASDVTLSTAVSALAPFGLWQQALSLLPSSGAGACAIAYNAAITACEKAGQWTQALLILSELPKRSFQPTVVTFSACASACEKALQWQQALALLHSATDKGCANAVTLNAVISACGKSQQWAIALLLLGSAGSSSLEPSLITYNSAIDACEKAARWDFALLLLEASVWETFRPNVVTSGAAISACEKAQAWSEAVELLAVSRSAQTQPNVILYGSAISAWGAQSTGWAAALGCLQQTKQELQVNGAALDMATGACERGQQWAAACLLLTDFGALNLRVDANFFLSAASACRKPSTWPHAAHVFQALAARDVECRASVAAFLEWRSALAALKGDEEAAAKLVAAQLCEWARALHVTTEDFIDRDIVHKTMLSTCEDGLQWKGILQWLDLALARRNAPDGTFCSSLLRTCGTWPQALQLLTTARWWGLKPTVLQYCAAVNACEGSQVTQKLSQHRGQGRPLWPLALGLLEDLQTQHLRPNVVTTGALVGVLSEGQLELGLKVFRELQRQQQEADVVMYNILIGACRSNHEVDKAFDFFREMQEGQVQPTVMSFNHLIAGLGAEKAPRALGLLEQLRAEDLQPNQVTYNALIACCKTGKMEDQAWQLFEEMQRASFEPNALTYASLLAASASASAPLSLARRGLRLLKSADIRSLQVYSAGVALCQRLGAWMEALHLLSEMSEIPPDVVTFSALISCCQQSNRAEEVLKLLAELQRFIL